MRRWRLLDAVAGLELVELAGARECCGFGGTFAIKNADTSSGDGDRQVPRDRGERSDAWSRPLDGSCLLQIGGRLSREGSACAPCISPRSSRTPPRDERARRAPFRRPPTRRWPNAQLRANLRNATDTIRDKRDRVVAEVPDWQELREAGRAIKADVLAHLDAYLLQFEAAVTAAGGHVHWAARRGRGERDRARAWPVPTGSPRSSRSSR